MRIDDRKYEIRPAALSVAFELLIFIGIRFKNSLSPFVHCKTYRSHEVRDNIAVIAGDHNNFLITYVTNDEVVYGMWSTWIQIPPKTWPTSGKVDDQFWLGCYGLFREVGRIDVDFINIGNEKKVSVLRQCGLKVNISPKLNQDGATQPTRLLRDMATDGASTSSLLLVVRLSYTSAKRLHAEIVKTSVQLSRKG